MSPQMMRVLMCVEARKLEVQEIAVPEPGPGQVRIRVKKVGICGSDGGRWAYQNALLQGPHIGGHEFSGTIDAFGPDCPQQWELGARVTAIPLWSCGTCKYCTTLGIPQHCAKRKVLGAHPTMPGAFAEYVIVDASMIRSIPAVMSFAVAATAEPAACAAWVAQLVRQYHSSTGGRLCGLDGLVVGAGPIGYLTYQTLMARGANRVIVTDVDAERLENVKSIGAIVINTKGMQAADVAEAVIKRLGSKADFAADCCGAGFTRDQCVLSVEPFCPTVVCGLHSDLECKTNGGAQVRSGSIQIGSFAFTPAVFTDALSLLSTEAVGFKPEHVSTIGFGDAQATFQLLFGSEMEKPMKVLIDPEKN